MTNTGLNPLHNFDTFLLGKSNTSARVAAVNVASNLAFARSPLFVSGTTGTGKTHLIQAIGNAVGAHFSRVWYRTSEDFAHSCVEMLRMDATKQFEAEIANLDLLIIDDVHFLANKERTQQEVFRLFEILISHSGKLVVTADRSPEQLIGWNPAGVNLFKRGLVVTLKQPDQELKVLMLDKGMSHRGLQISKKMSSYIASACSIRPELEGVLNRIAAESLLLKGKLDMDTARKILKSLCLSPETSAWSMLK